MRVAPISENLLLRFVPRQNGTERLKHVEFDVGEQLWAAEARAGHVLFPIRGVISLQIVERPGKQVEVALVGPEGYTEVPYLFGAQSTQTVAVALTAGEALLMKREEFRAHLTDRRFREGVERYARAFLAMLNWISVCNRIHVFDKTLIGRLLLIYDRTRADSLQLTQDFVSRVLGVRKATISRAAAGLQKAGAIGYDRRGHLFLLDRSVLEQRACSCVKAMRDESDRLISALGGF